MIFSKKTILEMPKPMRKTLAAGESSDTFEKAMRLQGKVFRDVPGRKTMQVIIGSKSYFIKQHFGVGWAEIFKNLITLKKPIISAMTEVRAIQKLEEIGIPNTPLVAYGQRGCNPASLQSFVLTEDLGEILTLEEIFKSGLESNIHEPSRVVILKALGELAAKLHSAGLVHRDFYLCHFVVKKSEFEQGKINLHLIDLHRMLLGQNPNSDAVMKDIAGLFFSMQEIGLSTEDFALFKQHYLPQSDTFWNQVGIRAGGLLTKFNSEKFQAKLASDRSKLD